jgi:parallel beta-helix repeat protein
MNNIKYISLNIFIFLCINFNVYSQGLLTDTVWVNQQFDSNTFGWGVTHFDKIQDGVNSVIDSGIVNVNAGIYNENVLIEKSLSLIGDGAENTIINTLNSNHCIDIRKTECVYIFGFTFINSGDISNWEVYIRETNNATIEYNFFQDKGIGLDISHNNYILRNSFQGRSSIFLINSWGNLIDENDMYINMPGMILIEYNSNNNVISNNIIIGGDQPSCTGIRSNLSSNNLYINNTIRNFRINLRLRVSNNCIIANNIISGMRWENESEGCGIEMFRSNNNTIINNEISSVADAGIILFDESNSNKIKCNSISNTKVGIELFYESDSNSIANNNIFQNSMGLILDNTTENIVYHNNFTNNEKGGFDDGINFWDYNGEGNYWSDYEGEDQNSNGIGDTQQAILPNGVDRYPLIQSVEEISEAIPELELAQFDDSGFAYFEIFQQTVWENETRDIGGSLVIHQGGSLTLNNVKLKVTCAGIIVDSLGSLNINDSEINSDGSDISVSRGSQLHIENSILNGFHGSGISILCDQAIIKDNIIKNCYIGIDIRNSSSNHQIIGNTITNTRRAIVPGSGWYSENILIQNNRIINALSKGIETDISNSFITGNVFKDIWGHPISIMPLPENLASGNLIYNNIIINCGSPNDSKNNLWYYNNSGNYWSDYLDKYPSAMEHLSYPGIWSIPYDIGGGNNKDIYPLISPSYTDTIISTPSIPILSSPIDKSEEIPINPKLAWLSAANASSYRLIVSNDSTFSSTIFNQADIVDIYYYLNELASGTKYFWRVIAINYGYHSNWSETWEFTTILTLPEQVILKSPDNAACIQSDSVHFKWYETQPCVTRYWMEISQDSLFTNVTIDSMISDTTEIKCGFINNQHYWWRVKAFNNKGWGPFSEKRKFNFILTNIDENKSVVKTFALFQNYPNPFNSSTKIEFHLPKQCHVKLIIYNIIGEEIEILINEQLPAGIFKKEWLTNNFGSGIYICKIHTADFTNNIKLILLK